jgi:3-hydroxyacyl-CoA dehydrogenase
MMSEDARLKIGVAGGGLTGHGIAYLFAAAGHRVGISEPSPQVRSSMPRRLQSIVELLDAPRVCTESPRKRRRSFPIKGADDRERSRDVLAATF